MNTEIEQSIILLIELLIELLIAVESVFRQKLTIDSAELNAQTKTNNLRSNN